MAKAERLRELMATEGPAIKQNTRVFNQGRYAAVARFDEYEQRKDEARVIKERAIENLPDLVDELRESVEANGGSVYLAADAADASDHVRSLMEDAGATSAVKSKSMTTEEIELNAVLEDTDIDVVETDLGEWLVQLEDDTPAHLVAPAAHLTRDRIAEVVEDGVTPGEPLESAEQLTRFARNYLGGKIKEADVGVTGANFIAAETGSILLVTSEGNARRVVSATDTHIAVAGVEKIVPSVTDFQPFIELIGRSATGQDLTAYLSMFTPPIETPVIDFDDDETPLSELDSGREFHLVLVDNGRMAMREDDELRETLYCIRCSACLNTCANFQSVGGHAFGGKTYTGGIGTGWEAGIEGLDVAGEFNDLCTGCSRCVNACPVGIDVPWINTVVRDRVNRESEPKLDWLYEGLRPDGEDEATVPLNKRVFGSFETLARFGSSTAPLSNWIGRRWAPRKLLERTVGIDSRRSLPAFRRTTFLDWVDAHGTRVDNADHRVVVYPDPYTNYVLVERGIAAVETLNALGVDVVVADSLESGRSPLSQGMITTARKKAEVVVAALEPYVADGRHVIAIEPSDLAMFRRDYETLVSPEAYERLASASFEVVEYVRHLLEEGADPTALTDGDETPVAYHAHCQQRTLDLEAPTVAVLEKLGYDVLTSDVECCGMAGSFGYKADYYELSMDVGEDLKAQFSTDQAMDRPVLASGTSCQEQLSELVERTVRHPIEVIAPDGRMSR